MNMRKVRDFIKRLFKKKENFEYVIDDNNYIDINLGLDSEGQVYFNFFKEGEQKKYEEFTKEERDIIIQMMAQSSVAFAQIEKQSSQNKKYIS